MRLTMIMAVIALLTGCAAPAAHPVVLRGDRPHHQCEYSDGSRCDLGVIQQRLSTGRYTLNY